MSTPPSSSHSFWTEAIAAADNVDAAPAERTVPRPAKRARFASDHDDDDDRGDDDNDGVDGLDSSDGRVYHATSLSYLPLRPVDPDGGDSAHAYLTSAEYAPTKFGDIDDYMRKKSVKVQNQNRDIAMASRAPDVPPIFSGLSFYINGNTTPPMEELRKLILQRGGVVEPTLRSKGMVDYIIAPILTMAKFREFKNPRYRLVREAWIVESCQQNKLLNWTRWKLSIEGGWEEKSRRGIEGFLGAAAKDQTKETDAFGPVKLVESQSQSAIAVAPIAPSAPTQSQLPPVAAAPSVLRQVATASTQSLLTSHPALILQQPPASTTGTDVIADVTLPKTTTAAGTDVIAGVHAAAGDSATKPRREGTWENYYVHESNRDAARLMKSDAFRAAHTSERGNESGFIDSFYQNSRLHHLSTWKTELRVLVATARASAVPVPTVLTSDTERTYVHVDFDAFFVSSGLATRPHLRGRPVVVCHSSRGGRESTSEVASASYEARACGVRNGMSLGRARALAGADLETIPYEFETYKRHSLAFYTVLMGYADELEAVSVDEALADVTGAVQARALAPLEAGTTSSDPAVQLADKIRDDVRAATGCEVSIGIASNILLARLATRRAKPAGIFHLTASLAASFLAELDVDELPSVGHSTRAKLKDTFGTSKCGELLAQSRDSLRKALGPKTGDTLYGFLRGVDERRLEPEKERKSVSAEMNYGIRFKTQSQAQVYVADLAREVVKRMRHAGVRGRHLTLKIMTRHPEAPIEPPKFLGHGWCETHNRSAPIANRTGGGGATDDESVIADEAVKLLVSLRLDPVELRGVGITITKLESAGGGPGGGQPGSRPGSARSKGQATLSFARGTTGNLAAGVDQMPSEEAMGNVDEAHGHDPVEAIDIAPAHPLPCATAAEQIIDITSSPTSPHIDATEPEPIDPEFLAALPPHLRDEVSMGRAQKPSRSSREPSAAAGTGAAAKPTTTTTTTTTRHAAAHITRQLRPRLKTQLTAKSVADLPLYNAWARADERERGREKRSRSNSVQPRDSHASTEDRPGPNNNTPGGSVGIYAVSELRTLGIDPDVFRELPSDVQSDVVAQERAHRRHRQQQQQQRQRQLARASASPAKSRAGSVPAAGPRSVPRPAPVVTLPVRPKLFGKHGTEDVAHVLSQWVHARPSPAERDASKVGAYLVKCIDDGSLGGIDHVATLLSHLRGLIQDLDGEESAKDAWWVVWETFTANVNEVVVKHLGAPLRL